jgi:hypothetical protein
MSCSDSDREFHSFIHPFILGLLLLLLLPPPPPPPPPLLPLFCSKMGSVWKRSRESQDASGLYNWCITVLTSASALQLAVVSCLKGSTSPEYLLGAHGYKKLKETPEFARNAALRHQFHTISSMMKHIYHDMLYTFLALLHHKDFRSMRYGSIL